MSRASKPLLVQYGAGNIGRSFIGQLFSRSGFDVIFIDVDPTIIQALNEKRTYTIVVLDDHPEEIIVENVSGISAQDDQAVINAISRADILATAVGVNVFPHIFEPIAKGLIKRWEEHPDLPLDIIVCENLRNSPSILREGIKSLLPETYPIDRLLGVVETSIGKMVPLQLEADRACDPLKLYAEAYNTLLVDKKGFKGTIPQVVGLDPKANMAAYVDRKLFIHNLGHAAAAYFGFLFGKGYTYIWEAVSDPEIRHRVESAMMESAQALIKRYPQEFTQTNQKEHIADLLHRFHNKALGDTIFRVGRDIKRKISLEDRIMGALRMCLETDSPIEIIKQLMVAACFFAAGDESGFPYPDDATFAVDALPQGMEFILDEYCGYETLANHPDAAQHKADLVRYFHNLSPHASKANTGQIPKNVFFD
jgi:mannitol-1-phosphate 5-dehydrogenase